MAVTKRITGEAYWKLHDLLAEGEKKLKAYGEWARKECRRLKLIPDVTDLLQGVVYDEPADPNNPGKIRKQVALVTDERVIAEAIEKSREIDKLNARMAAIVKQIAMKMNVRIDQVNAKKGEVTLEEDGVEYEEVKLD
jgi:hypothetical protein